MTIITVHGVDFSVEGDGFVRYHASEDFEIGVEAVYQHLNQMPAADVVKLHADGRAWVAADCAGDRPREYAVLEILATDAATASWKRKGEALIMVSAA